MTQPEALRLAEIMEQKAKRQKNRVGDYWGDAFCDAAAAELRRLYAELRRLQIDNDALGVHLSERMKDLMKVEAQRDALLEALRDLVDAMTGYLDGEATALHNALIVLAKAEGQQ